MRYARLFLTVTLLFFTLCAYAQKAERVSAEYTYYAPDNISLDEAKRIALERAQIQAIADAFGTIVSQSNTTYVRNEDGRSSVDFFSLGGSDVKGEWVETIGEPKYEISYVQNTLVVKVSVTGRIREIVTAGIDFKAKVLRNGTEDKYESADFRDGDDLYLSFLSPSNGYVAVYLVDMNQQAYCLLPYRKQAEGIYKVKANKPYIFFNTASAEISERPLVDEYVMTCSGLAEQNMVYVIFSPHSFSKATDENDGETLPRSLGYADFQKWLAKCRKSDREMNVKMFPISIIQ